MQLANKFGDLDYVFNATHPFAFLIQEHKTGSVLFIGKVEDPLMHEQIHVPNRLSTVDNKYSSQEPSPSHSKRPSPQPGKYQMQINYSPNGFRMERIPSN